MVIISSVNAQGVDLGLSVEWAAYNLGASSIEDPGTKYIIGENVVVSPNMSINELRKVIMHDHEVDYSGNPEYDAATSNWGESWRTPTHAEWTELIDCCIWRWCEYVTSSGMKVMGYDVTGPNGNSIFIPAVTLVEMGKGKYLVGGYYHCSTPVYRSKKIYLFAFMKNKRQMVAYKRIKQALISGYIRPVTTK